MKFINLYLIIPFLALACANIDVAAAESKTGRLGIGLELSSLAEKIESQNKPSCWQRGCLKPTTPRCSGLLIVLASDIHRLKIRDINFSPVEKYTIHETLNAFDNSISQALASEKDTKKLDFNRLSHEQFQTLVAIKKHYFDALPFVLLKAYGRYAEAHILEISRTRKEFEAKNNGALLELRD